MWAANWARIAQRPGMPLSPDILLGLARRACLPDQPTPHALGVDEWAYRKGQDYKTILVDLDTHRPIDLLSKYTVAAFATWLENHPGVDIIARDGPTCLLMALRRALPTPSRLPIAFT